MSLVKKALYNDLDSMRDELVFGLRVTATEYVAVLEQLSMSVAWPCMVTRCPVTGRPAGSVDRV
jgi:hypothetical protein